MEIVDLKYDEINSRFRELLGEKFNQNLLDSIYELLPQISAYKEEDKVFGFKMVVGYDFLTKVDKETSSFFEIKRCSLAGEGDIEEIRRLLKETVIFCSKNADLYIDQVSETEIAFGVFFTDYKHTGLLDRKVLHSKALILEGFINEGVRVLCNDEEKRFFIRLSFSQNFDERRYSANSFHLSDECRYWDGIFKKVKQTVHGTICLIVKPSWRADDDNFVGEKVTEFKGVSVAYSNSTDATDLLTKQYSIEMFLSMLDYDGVTILDTDGNVRSYHNIVKIKSKQDEGDGKEGDGTGAKKKVPGGARHQAFNTLKEISDWQNRGYVGVYFQSQEGEVEFVSFEGGFQQHYFRSEVMNYGDDNPCLAEVKDYYEHRYDGLVADWNACSTSPLFIAIEDLKRAHFGADNFYNEEVPARNLEQLLTNSWSSIKLNLQQHPGLLRRLLSILMITYVGNYFGEARSAIPHIEKSLKRIDTDLWKMYFDNKDFIFKPLLTEFGVFSGKQEDRWGYLVKLLKQSGYEIPHKVTMMTFYWCNRAHTCVDDLFISEKRRKNMED